MPRGKKAQVPIEVTEMADNSTNDNPLEEATVRTTNTKTRGKQVAPKGKGRGKAVDVPEDPGNEAGDNDVVDDKVSKSAQKKKVVEAVNKEKGDVSTEKPGRGRGRKAATSSENDVEIAQIEAETSEPPVAKKGRGRQKKEVVKAVEDDETEQNTSVGKESSNSAADSVPPTKGRKAKANATPETVSTETQKIVRGKASKTNDAANTEEAEVPVPEEKKKKGGRTNKNLKEEKANFQEPQQAEEQGEKEIVSPVVSKKGRPKKIAEKKDQQSAADNGSVDEYQIAQDNKKKTGRGRKENTTSASEVEPSVDASALPIQSAPPANIEIRKASGASRPTTPALLETPNSSESVAAAAEDKKGRGRTKKTPVVTPQRESKEVPARGSRTDKVIASKDTVEEEHVSEEPVVAKKRGGRPKKAVNSNQDEAGPSSPVRNERKRKEVGTDTEVAKKTLKKK